MVPVEVRVEAGATTYASEGDAPSGDSFTLLEPWGDRTWLAALDGQLVIARRVSDQSEVAPPGLGGAVGSAIAFASRAPNLIPVIGLRAGAGALWLLSELDRGLPIQRLLEVTRLSPLQATVTATDILAAVGSLHDAGASHGQLNANNVLVGRTGSARLGDWAMERLVPTKANGEGRQADLEETGALLGFLVESARRSRRGLLDEGGHLAVLEVIARRLARAPEGNGAVHQAVDTLHQCTNGSEQRARAEMASLVAALTRNPRWARYPEPAPGRDGNGHHGNGHGNGQRGNGHTASRHAGNGHGNGHGNSHGGNGQTATGTRTRHLALSPVELVKAFRRSSDTPEHALERAPEFAPWPPTTVVPGTTMPPGTTGAPETEVVAPPREPGPVRTQLRKAWRAVRIPVVVLLVVSLIVGVELAFLHDTISKQLHLVFGKKATTHHPVTDPSLATGVPGADSGPSAAGVITGMDLRGVGPCNPGSVCQLRLLVLLQPSSSTQKLRWQFQVVDRCSGHPPLLRAGNTAVARPDQSYVDTLSEVAMPSGSSLAVVAITTSPARAASQPWLVGSGGPCGPPARAGTP